MDKAFIEKPQLIIIAGPNGAGKTTSAFHLLPNFFQANEFVNADEIARGLSPFNQDSMAVTAGKLMIQRIKSLIESGRSFGIETTLSGTIYKKIINEARNAGYSIGIVFLFLQSISLAKERVKARVNSGGHSIPEKSIERRYRRGLKNLVDSYIPIVDWAYVLDNSIQNAIGPEPLFLKNSDGKETIFSSKSWEAIIEQAK